jgi:murein DD-endopeptidase MepM/ murein hydrolase activator NlpD
LDNNKLASASDLKIGQKLLIPGGRKISYPAYTAPSVSGLAAIKNFANSPSAKPQAGNKMNWPTVGYRITQYYSWRHTAVDIANKTGTPIYAADSGTIEYAGWGTGYGNQIVINHGGGKKTRYAHLSKFYISKGQEVTKGQAIGAMGSTGWSTGPHLHFEVIINNVKYNPLNYIK